MTLKLLSYYFEIMNLHHLKTFYLTAKHLSVTQAAREMEIAQPAATRHLRELQSETGIVLFNYRGKKMYLTNEGKILYEKAKKMFSVEEEITGCISEIKRLGSGLLSLSTQATFGDYFLPAVLLDFYKSHPGISLSVSTYLGDSDIILAIEKMEADLGIASVKPDSKVLKAQKIFTAQQYLVVSPSHPLAGEEIIKPGMLENELFVLPEKSSRSRKLIDRYFSEHGINARVLYELGHTLPILELVKNSVGITITYRETVTRKAERGEVCMIPIEDPGNTLSRDFYLIYNREKFLSGITVKFIDCLKEWAEKISRSENI